jgi:hypothetical protein
MPGFLTPSAQPNPFNDAIQNSPCAQKIVQTVNGVSVAAENLCAFHWQFKHGQRDFVLPVVMEP